MYTIILLIYLQSNLAVNLIGSTVTGEYPTKAACELAAVKKRGPIPIPRGYAAAWQDALCTKIDRNVVVGNERVTDFEKLMYSALQPRGCQSEGECRRIGANPPKP